MAPVGGALSDGDTLIPARGCHLGVATVGCGAQKSQILKGLLRRTPRQFAGGKSWDASKTTPTGLRSFFGIGTQGSCGAATLGYGRVPLQGTGRWMGFALGKSIAGWEIGAVGAGQVGLSTGASTSQLTLGRSPGGGCAAGFRLQTGGDSRADRKSTRLNSSHSSVSRMPSSA